MKIAIRTTHADPELRRKLEWFLQQPGCNWIVDNSAKSGGIYPKLTITRRGVFLNDGLENLHFHPSMALLRLMNRFRGDGDRYLLATGLKPGDTLLDLTMGLGTDALVGAWAVGAQGSVTGIEYSPILSALVNDGLCTLSKACLPKSENVDKKLAWEALALAAGRIKVICADHLDFLYQQPSSSVEVIYFDPMFRYTSQKSASIKPLHTWSDHKSLRSEVIREACRVARRCIVLKERKGSSEFTKLGFDILTGGKYSQVDYGRIRCSMFDV